MSKNYQTRAARARRGTGRATPKNQTKAPTRATTPPEAGDEGLPEFALPESVTVAMANLAEEAREGLLALAVGTGLQVMEAIMEEDVVALAGPKGKWNPERVATRHGTDQGQVTLGGRRMPIRRPRVRSADSTEELAVASYEHFSSTEVLGKMALERMVAKLSTRRYHAGLEPVGAGVQERARSTSKSSVSRRFVAATEKALSELMAGDLSGLDLVAVMIDGVYFAEHLCVVALGIDIQGHKWPLGVVEGSTENSTVVSDLLAGLRDRGLDTARPTLVVIDGAKALASAVRAVFDHPVIQRCQLHKLRNVQARLPDRLAATVGAKMRAAYQDPDPLVAEAALTALARDLERSHPGASGSLREGLTETLTIARLGVPPTLARTLRSTNSIESMIEICRDHAANVKRWRNGQMALRWCAAGMAEAKKQFRRVNGFMHLPALRAALDAHVGVADTPGTYDHSEEMAA